MAFVSGISLTLVLLLSMAVNLVTLPRFSTPHKATTTFMRNPDMPISFPSSPRLTEVEEEEEEREEDKSTTSSRYIVEEEKKKKKNPAMGSEVVRDVAPTAVVPAVVPCLFPDAVINLDHGDPTMFESFWRTVGDEATVVIQGWQTMSYFSDVGNVCWFLEPCFAEQVKRLHRLVGNAVAHDKHVVVGTGSTQLFQAALFALSTTSGDSRPMDVVSAVPYYSSYPAVTDYLRSGLFRWAGDAVKYKEEGGEAASCIELVCSPNNPDGFCKTAVLGSGKYTIHDLAYYWPQYVPITAAADEDIMLFTVSKSTGHAGTRIGWALVKDEGIARRMTKFVELNTIGVSKDSQVRAARVLGVVSDSHELATAGKVEPFFRYGRRSMADRWKRLREAVKRSGAFSLPDFPSQHCSFAKEATQTHPAFAWMRCEKEGVEDCQGLLKSHGILTRSGTKFGADARQVRISMLDRDPSFDLFVHRILAIR